MPRLLHLSLALSFLAVTSCSSGDDDSAATGGTGGTGTGGTGTGGTGMAGSGVGAGTGGGAGTGSMVPAKDSPADTSQAGIEAFLAALDYRSASWKSGTTAPVTPPATDGSPHGLVQIWFNQTVRQGNADGRGMPINPHLKGSMIVKELYTGTAVVGHAVMVRQDPSWAYYCTATEADRCFTGAEAGVATYTTTVSNCGCHAAGTIISPIPAP